MTTVAVVAGQSGVSVAVVRIVAVALLYGPGQPLWAD